ncbi:MAG: M20 metallopeptidase family protein [Christensenellales bacterium]
MRAFFEDLHRHPEPSHFENRTNRRVREQLKAHGIDMLCPKNNITIAVIHGAKPGKTVGLRFDTDALQLQELCDVPYKSEHDGLMHGCGHDAHTTCGVYVARLLKAHADELCGTYKIIFQPAEEGEHGADEVIATGLVSDVDAFFGLHVWSLYPTGTLHATPGGIWAEPDMFKITIHGKGGHGATPEQCVDAITAGAAVVQSLQTIVSRFTSPMDSVVVTVGSFHAGTRCNIIAQDAVLEGTLRAFDDNVHARLIEHFKRIITDVSAAYGCTAEIDINEVTGVVVNDEALCQIARETAAELVPPEKFKNRNPACSATTSPPTALSPPAALCRSACSRRKRIAATPITTACSRWMRMCCRCASRGWPPMPSAPQEADFSTALWKKRPVFPV